MKPATVHNDTIDQGATFYRVAVLYDDAAHTILTDLADKTPRATLMDMSGRKVIDFGCAIVKTEVNGVEVDGVAYALPRNVTAGLRGSYRYNLDLDYPDGVTSDRKLAGVMAVECGQGTE